jgi:hypothetical protein
MMFLRPVYPFPAAVSGGLASGVHTRVSPLFSQ